MTVGESVLWYETDPVEPRGSIGQRAGVEIVRCQLTAVGWDDQGVQVGVAAPKRGGGIDGVGVAADGHPKHTCVDTFALDIRDVEERCAIRWREAGEKLCEVALSVTVGICILGGLRAVGAVEIVELPLREGQ